MTKLLFFLLLFHYATCGPGSYRRKRETARVVTSSSGTEAIPSDTIKYEMPEAVEPPKSLGRHIETGKVSPDDLVTFAETLIGTPYKYASTNPDEGFDCSGFITYVLNHFNIKAPRSSVDFTDVGTEMPLTEAKRGDIILFTGTDSTIRIVGHMGIVTSNTDGEVKFIHSTSGKAKGVVISSLERYYISRFVKVISVFDLKTK